MTEHERRVIERIRQVQTLAGWPDDRVAQLLGVSRPLWGQLRLGKARAGRKFLTAAARTFPASAADCRAVPVLGKSGDGDEKS